MIKSLFSGLSGVRGHQTQMDVIGNNIANINTIGYKRSRLSFRDALNITMSAAVKPGENRGGMNPMQMGIGSSVGSIKNSFSQGSLQDTGNTTDLAIQGDGFFIVSDGTRDYYTRAGGFQFEAEGILVNSEGYGVQGKSADTDGNIPADATIGNIRLPFGRGRIAAKASTSVSLAGNLDAGESLLGTITNTRGFLATSAGTDNFNGLYANGRAETFLSLTSGIDTLTVGDGTNTATYMYGTDFNTLTELATRITTDFGNGGYNTMSAAVGTSGQLTFTALQAGITTSVNSQTNSGLDAAFENVDGKTFLNANDTVDSDGFAHIATYSDALVNLRNATGESMGLQVGDDVSLLSATVSGTTQSGTALLTDIDATTTLEAFRGALDTALFGANPAGGEDVVIRSDGGFQITGAPGASEAVTNINIGSGPNANDDTRTSFGVAMTYTEEQAARDVVHSATTTVYDSLGDAHKLTMIYKKTSDSSRWTWEANLDGNESIRGGNTGTITFNPDGTLKAFEYDSGATDFRFDANNGAETTEIKIDVGQIGTGNGGINHYSSSSTVVVTEQDGYTLGNLESISVNEQGVLTGNFSNGVSQTIAQIVLAQFNNPSGLFKMSNNLFATSGNSGHAVIGDPGTTIQSTIASGALEQSNVDLAEEFTRLIVAQRGFMASSRVITTSDDVLTELVNLKR